ncbi:BMA-KLE-2 [Dirofilaria immitis]|nr:BMA-KLE-2 [Dirofilaria immitis]
MADDDELSTRYAFLLQPIRDLQKNWDIDISHLLEEFVEKIRQLSDQSGSEDVNIVRENKFNFAEAAILIQGSTMVYGKKVEYVHGLARNFYEQLHDMENAEDDVDEFTREPDDPCELIQFTNLRTVDWKTLMLKSEAKPPPLLPQIPISLMPLADFEKTNVTLYSSRNLKELIGKKMISLSILASSMRASGALLLDLANAELLNDFMIQEQDLGNSAYVNVVSQQDNGHLNVVDNEQYRGSVSQVEKVRRVTSATNLNTITRRDTSHVELVSDIAVGGDVMRVDTSRNCVQNENDEMGDVGYDGPAFDSIEDNKDGDHHPADEEMFGDTDEDEPVMDLFRFQKYKHAPYRKKLGLKTLSTLNDFLQRHIYHSLPKGTGIVPNDDFSIIFGKLMRNLENQRMNAIKARISQHTASYQQPGDIQSDESEVEADEYETANSYSSDEEEDGAGIPDDGNLTFANMPNDDLEDRVHVSSLYMNFDDPNLLLKPAEQMTYQDLLKGCKCGTKAHIEYWSSAEETTSKLCKRVQQWEEKIQPLLEEEETRREFNIHQYGAELLEQYERTGQIKNFAELMENVSTRYDVSRYCLASLMLANTGNIEIDFDYGTEPTKDGRRLALKLLKKERHHQQFSEPCN